MPLWVTEEVNKLIFNFLWTGKPEKIKRETIIATIEKGGLKMTDFDSMVKAQKAMWIGRFLNNNNHIWKYLFANYMPKDIDIKEFLTFNYDVSDLNPNMPKFYRQVLLAFAEASHQKPESKAEVIRECLWFNKFITF